MMDFSAFRSIGQENYKLSIDTLTKVVRKDRLNKYISKVGHLVEDVTAHSKISSNVKKRLFENAVTSSSQIITPHFKNIIIETPHELNLVSDYKKYLLTAFGLSQPHKPLHLRAIDELQHIFNTLGVDSFDLAIDSPKAIPTHILMKFGMIDQYQNTIYINTPPGFSYITKIKYYDKRLQLKAKGVILPYPLYRLELTIRTKGKLKDMFIPIDEIQQVINMITHIKQ